MMPVDLAVSPDLLDTRSSPFGVLQGVAPAAAVERQPATNVAAVPTASAMQPMGRDGVVQFWMAQGAPQHVAEGIADRVNVESGFKPTAWNPNDMGSPSGGLYQHHADRLTRLKEFAAAQGKPWTDGTVQNQFALTEVMGGDAIAAKHWQEILAAPDRKTAEALWTRYFERGMPSPGSPRVGGRFAGMGPTRPVAGSLDAALLPAQLSGSAASTPQAAAPTANLQLQAQPQTAAAPSPAAHAMRAANPLQPVPLPPAPNLVKGYQDALASVLNGQRRGFGSVFG